LCSVTAQNASHIYMKVHASARELPREFFGAGFSGRRLFVYEKALPRS
jgi:hypothetical protein